jgi:hypothetical protein
MKEGLIKDTYEALIKELQTIITVSYILAVGIGMLFTHQKFSEFGINIFEYADVFDFLIAPFSDFKILLFTIISLSLPYFLFRVDLIWRIKYPKFYSKMYFGLDKKNWFNLFRYFSYSIVLIFYLYISAEKYGEISKKQIMNQSSIKLRFSDNEIKKGKMIGKINDIIFLLAGEKVEAIPITSLVKEFEIIK